MPKHCRCHPLPLLPCFPVIGHRHLSIIFPDPRRPSTPGLTISCFLKSLPNWVTRYFHGEEDRSSFRGREGEGEDFIPSSLPFPPLFFYFSINGKKRFFFFARSFVYQPGRFFRYQGDGGRGEEEITLHTCREKRELFAIYSCCPVKSRETSLKSRISSIDKAMVVDRI